MKRVMKFLSLIGAGALILSFATAISAPAQTSGISLDFAAAEPLTYSHVIGGGKWNNGTVNVDIERSLEGEDFACKDRVSYLTKINVANSPDLVSLGAMTLRLNFSFDLDTTGQSGVALSKPISASINTSSDSASKGDGGSSVTEVTTSETGPKFVSGSELLATYDVSDVEANETIVLRIDLTLDCQNGAGPTGNVQAKLESSYLIKKLGNVSVNPAEAVGTGAKTIDLKTVNRVSKPELAIAKTVTFPELSCPGTESVTIEPDQFVKYCYVVTNPSNTGGKLGAPVFNLSVINDDSGIYPDFTVPITSGLTDIDGDGQSDDLAAGAIALAEKVISFDGNKDTTLINIAVVSGTDAPVGGNTLTASDTATVFVDAPEILPDISVTKTPSVSEVPDTGGSVTFTVVVTNNVAAEFKLTSLADDTFGDLNSVGSCAVPQTIAATSTYSCAFTRTLASETLTPHTNTVTASGQDLLGNTDSATASATVNFTRPAIEVKKTPATQTVVEGFTATFTIAVKNIGNVPLTNIAVTDTATPSCDKTFSSLAVGVTETYTCTTTNLLASFTNVAVASGYYGTTQVTDDDSAAVVIDFLPKIEVTKTASVTSMPETGGSVTYIVVVTNKAVENFTLNSLIDDNFGDLNGVGTCITPQTIAASAEYSCTFTKSLSSDSLTSHVNVVTASGQDPEGNQTSANDDATVTFSDVLPDISLVKTVNPTAARWTGDYVNYKFVIANLTGETVTVTSFIDNQITLSAECLALVGYVLAPFASVECETNGYYLIGQPGGSFVNTATVIAQDNELNQDSATSSATVNFWWYGRTPGYWKTHSEAWTSGYTPTMFIQNVFSVPSGLLSSGILDLNKNGTKDSLMQGLAYQGGSGITGAAQILFRAAIAALLNEAYYGADYPAEVSPSALITNVNTVLATNNRAQYLALASYYDFWNNAVHASLP
jgi:uncharacterized repeat protein (TIGR01451 family)